MFVVRADLVPKAQEGRGRMVSRARARTSPLPEFFDLVRKELLLAPVVLLQSPLRPA